MCQQYKIEASMTKHNTLFIGLDTHETYTEVAYIEDPRGEKLTHLSKIPSNKALLHNSRNNVNQNTLTRHYILFMKPVLVVIGFTVY